MSAAAPIPRTGQWLYLLNHYDFASTVRILCSHLIVLNPSARQEDEEVTPGPENLVIVGVSAVVLHPPTDAASVTVTGMRVRSFSHWAPAAIGPYSQAVRVRVTGMEDAADDDDDCASHSGPQCSVFYAGQIGLIPETGSLPETDEVYSQTGDGEGPYAQQGWLSLRHVHRVLEVLETVYILRLTATNLEGCLHQFQNTLVFPAFVDRATDLATSFAPDTTDGSSPKQGDILSAAEISQPASGCKRDTAETVYSPSEDPVNG
ncbi:diphthine--ammonia ligase [Sparganum proliferum]